MISKLAGEFVALTADRPGIVNVTGGTCEYEIACLPLKNYPKPAMPFPDDCILMTNICSLAKRTTFAVGQDEHKLAMQCVNVKLKNDAVHAAACDGNRIMMIKDTADPGDEREFLIPGRALQMLASLSSDSDVFEVGDVGSEIIFLRGDMIFTARTLAVAKYIDTNRLMKSMKPAYAAVAEAEKLKEALSVVSVAASAGKAIQPINLVLSDGEIALKCSNEYGSSNMAVPANVSSTTPGTGFYYNVSYLQSLFQVMSGKVKLEIDAKGFMVIKTRSEVYFQGPVRPPSETAKSAKEAKPVKGTNRAKGAEEMKEEAA
jgi:DNA polymerase III sliding clamp (beta) subunit (PCNA family)